MPKPIAHAIYANHVLEGVVLDEAEAARRRAEIVGMGFKSREAHGVISEAYEAKLELPQKLADACQAALDSWMMGDSYLECKEEYDEVIRLIKEIKG